MKATKSAKGAAPAAETATAVAEAPAAEKAERGSNDVFHRTLGADGKPAAPSKKLPPQAQTIVNAVEAAGKKGIGRKDLNAALEGVLQTRQPVGRIVTYYQKLLQEVGAVTITSGANK